MNQTAALPTRRDLKTCRTTSRRPTTRPTDAGPAARGVGARQRQREGGVLRGLRGLGRAMHGDAARRAHALALGGHAELAALVVHDGALVVGQRRGEGEGVARRVRVELAQLRADVDAFGLVHRPHVGALLPRKRQPRQPAWLVGRPLFVAGVLRLSPDVGMYCLVSLKSESNAIDCA